VTLIRSMETMMLNHVKDNVAHHRFEIEKAGAVAFATYRRANNIVTVVHTEVPKTLEGHGVGSALAKSILERLRANGEKVEAQCPFIAAYIRKHAEYRDLLAVPLPDVEHVRTDAMLDEALEESFPASDPAAITPRD